MIKDMKIYYVWPKSYYGTNGWVVIANSKTEAFNLVKQVLPQDVEEKLVENLVVKYAGRVKTGWVSEEFDW